MDQGSQQQHGTTNASAQAHGPSPEVSRSASHSNPHRLIEVQLMRMLEPSYALIRRHEQDQHRVAAENELKLQKQLKRFRLRIERLERHAQKSEPNKATLERVLRDVVQEKSTLMGRVKQLEDDVAHLRRRLDQVESDKAAPESRLDGLENDRWPTGLDSTMGTSPETATPSVRSASNIPAEDYELASTTTGLNHESASIASALDPVNLHPLLPSMMFMVDPETNKTSGGSEFPLKLISSLGSNLKDLMADEMIDTTKLAKLQKMTGSIKGRCLHRYLQKSRTCHNKSIWTKEHEQFYACRTCVNKQRVCMSLTDGQVLVLPLHPVLKALSRGDGIAPLPSELQYWISAKRAPHYIDIWDIPTGKQ